MKIKQAGVNSRRNEKVAANSKLNVLERETKVGQKSRGVLLGILGEGVRPSSRNTDLISDQKLSFSTHLEVVTKRNITLGLRKKEIMSSLLRLKPQQIHFEFAYKHFLSYSFRIEKTNTLIHNRSSFVNHTRFQTKMGNIYTPFSDQNGIKVKPFGAAPTCMAGIRSTVQYLPPPTPGQKFLHGWLISEEFQKRMESPLNHLWGNIGTGPF